MKIWYLNDVLKVKILVNENLKCSCKTNDRKCSSVLEQGLRLHTSRKQKKFKHCDDFVTLLRYFSDICVSHIIVAVHISTTDFPAWILTGKKPATTTAHHSPSSQVVVRSFPTFHIKALSWIAYKTARHLKTLNEIMFVRLV